MESPLQAAMAILIGVFHKHAGKDQCLNKAELKKLLETEFASLLGSAKDKNMVDSIFTTLDQDGSGSVNFTEFAGMVVGLTVATNQMLQEQQ